MKASLCGKSQELAFFDSGEMMDRLLDQIDSPFYSPFTNTLIKGVEEDGKWIVYLEASNELLDQEGESINMKALEKAKDYYLGHGVLSWDHKHKQTHDPKYIIGEPLAVRFTEEGKTLVKGFLYQKNPIAKGVWDNILSGATKLGSSVGGGILRKSESEITKVIWDETAITHKPVNEGTYGSVTILPFEEFAKALMAGGGVNAGSFTGGRALIHESLQGSENAQVSEGELTNLFDGMLKKVIAQEIRDYNDMVAYVLSFGYDADVARSIIYYVAQHMPTKGI